MQKKNLLTLIISSLYFEQRSLQAINQNIYSFLTLREAPTSRTSKYQSIFHAFHTTEPDTRSGESGIRLQTMAVVSAVLLFAAAAQQPFHKWFPFHHALTSKKLQIFKKATFVPASSVVFTAPPPLLLLCFLFLPAVFRWKLAICGKSSAALTSRFYVFFYCRVYCANCALFCYFNVKC